jgi:S1-C subfamily serine protease
MEGRRTVTLQRPSWQSLFLQAAAGEKILSSATGFVMNHGGKHLLVTNRHVVTGVNNDSRMVLSPSGAVPDRLHVKLHGEVPGKWYDGWLNLVDRDQRPLWVEHPSMGPAADFVALKLPSDPRFAYYPYANEGEETDIDVVPTDAVSVIGFPFGLSTMGAFPIWSTGFVASEPELNYDDKPLFLIDCRARPGQSGSPVVAFRSGGFVNHSDGKAALHSGPVQRLMGIYSGRINEQSDLGRVWKLAAIRELIASIS